MELKNIAIYQYFELADQSEYDYLLKYCTDSKDVFSIGDFTALSFGIVKDLQYKFSRGLMVKEIIDAFCEIKAIELKDFAKTKWFDFVKACNHLKKQIEFINSIEDSALTSGGDARLEEAGIDRFNKFGYVIQVDKLAGGDVTKYEQVKNLPYSDCFAKLYLEKERDEFNEAYRKILNRQHGKV